MRADTGGPFLASGPGDNKPGAPGGRKPRTRVFAYGTLQEPRRLKTLLAGVSGWRSIGPGTVRGALYNVGRYPALILPRHFTPSAGAASGRDRDERRIACTRVPGLVIELDAAAAGLASLDAYEGVGDGLYQRCRCRIAMASGERRTAWVYIYSRPITGLARIDAWPPFR